VEAPPLVRKAVALAAGPENRDLGELVHVLAARRGLARVAAIGSADGVLAAWVVSALPPRTPFFCVEADAAGAAHLSGLLAEDANVAVLTGDWRTLLPPEAPFDLLVVLEPEAEIDAVVGLLAPGATVVVPVQASSDLSAHPLLTGTTLRLSDERSVLVAVRH
jgi:hypothetical protein